MIHISLSSKRRGQADPTQKGGCRPGGGSRGAKLIAGFSDSVMERCGGFYNHPILEPHFFTQLSFRWDTK